MTTASRRALPWPLATVTPILRCACGGGCPRCRDAEGELAGQPKLRISRPGDATEREADRVAEEVLRAPEAAVSSRLTGATKVAESSPAVETSVAHELAGLEGQGQPVPSVTRAFFENRLGADLSAVRVHHNGKGAALA